LECACAAVPANSAAATADIVSKVRLVGITTILRGWFDLFTHADRAPLIDGANF